MASKRLYVGNLAYDVREEQLRELFAPYGPVAAVQIIGTRGFAFVEIPAERLQDALTLNGSLQFGRPIVVNEARPRGERTDFRGGADRKPGGMYRGSGDRGGGPGYQGARPSGTGHPGGSGRPGGGGGRPGGGRPGTGRPASGRPGVGRPGAGGTRSGRDRAERRERAERYDRRGW